MPETAGTPELPLSPGAERLLGAVPGDAPGAHVWLTAALERHGSMASHLVGGLDVRAVLAELKARLAKGDSGPAVSSATLLTSARDRAVAESKVRVGELDVVAAILAAAGHEVKASAVSPSPAKVTAPAGAAKDHPAPRPVRLTRPTPTLDKYGRDLTCEAAEGRLNAVLARDVEMELVIETLCRRMKRNPLLLGPAGTGKTAIAEGVALRIAAGQVPPMLQGVRIFALQPSSLVAGAGMYGELDARMKAVVAEASQEGVVLFIDEMHAILGAGGREGKNDIASMLKPALARGDLACIAATTDDEFRLFIESDRALERRFNAIRINELSAAQTLPILQKLRDSAPADRSVAVTDDVLGWLIDVSQRFLPNRRLPDKAIDLFDQCIAFAMSHQRATLERADAEMVVSRMLGRPAADGERFPRLRAALVSHGLLSAEEAEEVTALLDLRSRGLDPRPARPDLVLALGGAMAERAPELAAILSGGLFGSEDRVIRINLGQLQSPEDVRVLLGAPPSFVGYQDRHLLDALGEMPCAVVLFEAADAAHPQVVQAIIPGIRDGMLTDMRGRRIYFSDAVVILAGSHDTSASNRSIGFHQPGQALAADAGAAAVEGLEQLEDFADFVLLRPEATSAGTSRSWVEGNLLSVIADRHRERGIELQWDPTVLDWLGGVYESNRDERRLEKLVEREIGPVLIRALRGVVGVKAPRYVVRRVGSEVVIEVIGESAGH